MSMLILTRHKGKPNPLFLDGRTYEPLFTFRLPGEARWHPTDPDVMLYVRDNRIGRFNVRTGKDHTIWFSGNPEILRTTSKTRNKALNFLIRVWSRWTSDHS
jgi:prepilin-type processing-associated H-X9-DG protein